MFMLENVFSTSVPIFTLGTHLFSHFFCLFRGLPPYLLLNQLVVVGFHQQGTDINALSVLVQQSKSRGINVTLRNMGSCMGICSLVFIGWMQDILVNHQHCRVNMKKTCRILSKVFDIFFHQMTPVKV